MSVRIRSQETHRDHRIDALKALASQCIVLHHLAIYGPMPDIASVLIPGLVQWLDVYGRYAVQVFLVTGGYLAAPGLWRATSLLGPLQRRMRRLLPTLWAALIAVLVSIAGIRFGLGPEHIPQHTPQWPTLAGLLANVLMLQDVLDIPALSAGIWYVAIDFQLYVLLAVLLAVLRQVGAMRWADLGMIALTALSLAWINLNTGWEMWAPYFFGAYGLGILAWRSQMSQGGQGTRYRFILIALTGLALTLAWRDRVALAGLVALALSLSPRTGRLTPATQSGLSWVRATLGTRVAHLGRISYSVFLVHYPVCLAMSALATFVPSEPALHLGLLALTWWLSVRAGDLLYRQVESRFSP